MSFVADYNLPHFPTLCSPVLVLVPTALARDCYWAHCKGPLPPPSPHRVGSTLVLIVPRPLPTPPASCSQVLDARDPNGTRCGYLEKHVKEKCPHKHMLLLLNKVHAHEGA